MKAEMLENGNQIQTNFNRLSEMKEKFSHFSLIFAIISLSKNYSMETLKDFINRKFRFHFLKESEVFLLLLSFNVQNSWDARSITDRS